MRKLLTLALSLLYITVFVLNLSTAVADRVPLTPSDVANFLNVTIDGNDIDPISDLYYYSSDFYDAYICGHCAGAARIVFYTEKNTDIVSAILFSSKGGPNAFIREKIDLEIITLFLMLGNIANADPVNTLALLKSGGDTLSVNNAQMQIDEEGGIMHYLMYPSDTPLDVSSLPYSFSWTDNDFFASEERVIAFKDNLSRYAFDQIFKQVNDYISAENPPLADSSYTVLSILNDFNVLDVQKNMIIKCDKVENKTLAYYNGIEELGAETFIVPYIDDTTPKIRIGFVSQDWLFFDHYIINVDGEIILKSVVKSPTRDVLTRSGGAITEYTDFIMLFDEMLHIGESNESIIRFKNEKDGKAVDHTLTVIEKDALYSVAVFRETYLQLSNLSYRWNTYANWVE